MSAPDVPAAETTPAELAPPGASTPPAERPTRREQWIQVGVVFAVFVLPSVVRQLIYFISYRIDYGEWYWGTGGAVQSGEADPYMGPYDWLTWTVVVTYYCTA